MTCYKLLNQSGIESLKKAESKAISETEIQINYIDGCICDYEAVIERLGNLAEESCHEVKVPLGKFAFMPGHLVETDRITVNLGGKWFVETTVKHASEIIRRRIKALKERKEKFEKQKELMTTRLNFTDQFGQEGEKCIEIVEEVDEEAEKAWRVKHKENLLRARRKELEERENSEHITVEEFFQKFNYNDDDDDDDEETTETAKRIERPKLPVRNEVEVAAAARAVAAAELISSTITEEENEEKESDDDDEIKADFKEYLRSIGISVSDAVCNDNPSCAVAGTDDDDDGSGDNEDYTTKVEDFIEAENVHLDSAKKMVEKNISTGTSSDISSDIEMNREKRINEQSRDKNVTVHHESVRLIKNVYTNENFSESHRDRVDEILDVREGDTTVVIRETSGKESCYNTCDGKAPENKQQFKDDANELVTISVVMPKSSDARGDGCEVDDGDDDEAAKTTEEDWREFIHCIGTLEGQNSKTSFKSNIRAAEKLNGDWDKIKAQSYMGMSEEKSIYCKERNSVVRDCPKVLKDDENEIEKLEKPEVSSHTTSSLEVSSKRRVSWKDLVEPDAGSSSSDQSDEYDDDDSSGSSSCYSDEDNKCARTIVVNFKHSSVQPVSSSIIPSTNGTSSEVSLISTPGDIIKLYKSQPKSILKTRHSDDKVPKATVSKNELEVRPPKKSVTVSQPSPAASQPESVTKLVCSNVIEKTVNDVTAFVGEKNTGHRMSKFKARQIAKNQL